MKPIAFISNVGVSFILGYSVHTRNYIAHNKDQIKTNSLNFQNMN